MTKKKTKKDLKELAMIYRFDLGGFRYKKEYENMIELAYKYDLTQLKKLEKENNQKQKISIEKREKYIKEHGTEWTQKLGAIIIEYGNLAGKSLDIAYAQDLLKIHEEKYIYYRK